jgi:hypothetical protein
MSIEYKLKVKSSVDKFLLEGLNKKTSDQDQDVINLDSMLLRGLNKKEHQTQRSGKTEEQIIDIDSLDEQETELAEQLETLKQQNQSLSQKYPSNINLALDNSQQDPLVGTQTAIKNRRT